MNRSFVIAFYFISILLQAQGFNSNFDENNYQNPILHSDYSDPDVVRVGEDYYMVSSSFNAAPGLPILHSKDMVHWKIVNHALPKLYPIENFNKPQHGNGVWAPCIRFHDNNFFIYWGDPDFGIYMVKTQNPLGAWSVPKLVLEGKGLIDPSPLWDDNGKAYLVHAWAGSRAGVKSLLTLHEMDPDGTSVLDEGTHIYDGHLVNPTIEGPKFYKRGGYYYIFAPAGGVEYGWQLALRSKNIYGPYEVKKVLEQGSTNINGPHQGAWVQTPSGSDWFYHFQDKGPYGRIVHLQPMKWQDDWPFMGQDFDNNGIGEPVLEHPKPLPSTTANQTIQTSDFFEGDHVGLQWQWNANSSIKWYAKLPENNFLRLFPFRPYDNHLLYNPNLLLQKFPAPNFQATTKLKLTPENSSKIQAGLVVMGFDYASLSVDFENNQYSVQQRVNEQAHKDGQEKRIASVKLLNTDTVWLRVAVEAPDARCVFSYSTDGVEFVNIGTEFYAKEGGWIGAKVGLFCTKPFATKAGGFADFYDFKVKIKP